MRAALSCRNVIGVIAALAVLGHAASALGQSGDVEIFAYDEYIGLFSNDPPTIPPSLRRDAQMAFDAHKAVLGEPPIQTIYKNKPVIFLTNDKGSAAATAGNFVPYEIDTRQKESVCFGPQKKNWCSPDHHSVWIREHNLKPNAWKIPLLLSHEFIHLWQHKWLSRAGKSALPHWMLEGMANGWGYGIMENFDPFQRNFLAQRLADGGKLKEFAFFLGLRYYDQSLDVDRAIKVYPAGHPAYPRDAKTTRLYDEIGLHRCRDIGLKETKGCRDLLKGQLTPEQQDLMKTIDVRWAHEHVAMAGYMTGSFYRYMLLGRPSGAKAIEAMMKRPTPADMFSDGKQQRGLLNWMDWLDGGIRAYKVPIPSSEIPAEVLRVSPLAIETSGKQAKIAIWPGGVRQIYAEMIAELADLPDTIVKNRRGYLMSKVYDSLLWSKGCPRIDLTGPNKVQNYTNVGLGIIAAQCLRVKVARNSNARAGGRAAPSFFVVTVTHRADQDPKPTSRDEGLACIDLQLASRGQLIRTPTMVTWTDETTGDKRCSIQWVVPFDPLAPTTAGGNEGYQTVLLINASEKATETIRRRVDVSIVQVAGDVKGNLVGTPESKGDQRRPRKRLSMPQGTELQPVPPSAVAFRIAAKGESCDAYSRRVFKCGPRMGIGLLTGDVNRNTQAFFKAMTAPQHSDLRPWRSMEDDLFNAIDGGEAELSSLVAGILQRRDLLHGLEIKIFMEPIEFGQVGTFPARVEVAWYDGQDSGMLESLGPRGPRLLANGCADTAEAPSQASVTIARHAPGFMVGTLSARLYEPNDGDDVCQRPLLDAGTLTVSFTTVGQFPDSVEEGGTSQIDTRPNALYGLQTLAGAAEMLEVAGAFGADAGADAGAGAGDSGRHGGGQSASADPRVTATPNAECPAPGDVEAYLAMLIGQMTRAGVGRQEAEQMRAAYRQLPPETLREAVCDWVAEGRPQ